jgi:hypothetical protein
MKTLVASLFVAAALMAGARPTPAHDHHMVRIVRMPLDVVYDPNTNRLVQRYIMQIFDLNGKLLEQGVFPPREYFLPRPPVPAPKPPPRFTVGSILMKANVMMTVAELEIWLMMKYDEAYPMTEEERRRRRMADRPTTMNDPRRNR